MADEGFKIADAYVEVHARANESDGAKAAEEIEKEVDSKKPTAKVGATADQKAGRAAGEDIAESAGKGISSRSSFLRGIFSRTVTDSRSDIARAALDNGDVAAAQFALGFQRDAAGKLRNASSRFVAEGLSGVESELQRIGESGGDKLGNGFLSRVVPSITSFGSVLSRLGPKISEVGAAVTRIGVLDVFGSLAVGAMNFGASLGPVLGLLAAIPAVAMSAAAALSTLAIGLAGVFKALSAFGKSSGGGGGGGGSNPAQQIHQLQEAVHAASEAVQQADHGIVIAERSVADAQHQTKQAQEALTQARLDAVAAIQAYDNQLADAQISERQAMFDLQDAQQTLNQYQQWGITSGENYQKAQLGVVSAQQKLKEASENVTSTQKAQADAQAKGVDGNSQVISAQDQVNKALEQQSDASYNLQQSQQQLADATQKLADAQYNLAHSAGSGGAAGGINQFAAALAKLSPNAREFVLAVVGLKGQFDALRATVQQNMFAGLATEVKQTAAVTFPTLTTGMGLVATSFNNMAKAGFEAVKTPIFQGALATVFRGTAQATQMWASATGPLITGLANLAAVGMPFILQFTKALTSWLTAKGVFLSSAEGAQKMHEVLGKAADAASNLWHIALNLGTALKNIAGAMHVEGLLASLSKVTAEFAKWTGSAQGQQQLSQFFQFLTQTAAKTAAVMPLVWNVISKIINFLNANPAIKNLAEDFLAWSIALGPVISLGGKVVSIVGGFSKIVGPVKALAASFKEGGTAAKLLSGEMTVLDVIMSANPIFLIVAALVVLGVAFYEAYHHITPFRNAVNEVASFLKTVVVDAFHILQSVVTTVFSFIVGYISGQVNAVISFIGFLSRIPGDIGGWFRSAYNAVVGALGDMVSFVSGIPGKVIGALGDVGSMLYDSGKSIIRGLINGIKNMAGGVKDAVSGVLKDARNLLPFSPAKEGPFSGKGWTLYSGQAMMQGLSEGIDSQLSAVKSSAARAMTAASSAFKGGKFGLALTGAGGSSLPNTSGPTSLSAANNSATPGSTITVGNLTLQVNGAMDLTSDSDRRKLVRKIRDELVKLESSTR
jgi:hypothetical protein